MKIENLTIREKLRLICGKDYWHTEDFGGKLPSVTMSDGPVGVKYQTFSCMRQKF